MFAPATIELIDPPDSVPAGESVPLRFAVTRPTDEVGAVVLPAGGVVCPAAELNTDLMSDDITLSPGETVSLTVGVRFATPRDANWSALRIQINPLTGFDKDRTLVSLPARPLLIVPSLGRCLELTLNRVCRYGEATKVEVVACNISATDLTELELGIGPAINVLAGPLKKCVPLMRPGDMFRFDLVVNGPEVEFTVTAYTGGARVEGRRVKAVPSGHDTRPASPKLFAFLEPRSLTTDRVTLKAEGRDEELPSANGVMPVRGGKTRYRLTIYPSHTLVTGVRLYSAAGQVEVEDHPPEQSRSWPFTVTIVENPFLTQLVRLDYDVQLPGETLRGELYLSIRPSHAKLWAIALTAGVTTTLRGLAGAGGILGSLHVEDGLESTLEQIPELLEKGWVQLLQLSSIPFIRGLLWVADQIWRPIEEG